jgi:CO dehydrogenase maturation factor
MKIAISGKGGVGKTTLAALLAMAYVESGYRVIVADADPDGNMASALGIPPELAEGITPIVEMGDLIYERTGAQPGTIGSFFRLNPKVDDIPDHFSVEWEGIRLLVMGTIRGPLAGCVCPESAMLKALFTHLILGRDEVLILDMDAGVEHLGRGTAQGVDAFIIVVEPGQRSLQTARTVKRYASGLGVSHCFIVASKTNNEEAHRFIKERLPDYEILGFMDFDPDLLHADTQGSNVYHSAPKSAKEVREIKDKLEQFFGDKREGKGGEAYS